MSVASDEFAFMEQPGVPAVVAGDVAELVVPVAPDTRCEVVAERLTSNPECFAVPVVRDDQTPVGLLNRFRLLERLSQRFGRDLYLRRTIAECLEGPPLLLDRSTPIDEVGAQLFADGRTHVLDGFIVTDGGRYFGVGTGVTLTRALSGLTVTRERASVALAAQQNAAKSAFIANVSHELRTPLKGVIGLTALLRNTRLAPDQRELIELLEASGEALLTMVDDVLDYSKIEASHFELDSVAFDPRALVTDVVRVLGVRARGKNLQLAADVDPAVPAVVTGDPKRLRQVLLNLGGNAVKFTEQGHVTFGISAAPLSDREVTLSVRVEDSGIGIASDKVHSLFRPYTQADSSIARRFGGTGLGLAICRGIVEQMGGTIAVSSKVGQGTTFTFLVSLGLPDPSTMAVANRSFEIQTSGSSDDSDVAIPFSVLVAEDNSVNQLVATSLLRRLGCEVHAVGDGAMALKALSERNFDLVLMDCFMPNLGGIEATRRIRRGEAGASAKEVPIVALTASATTGSQAACLAAGMDAYLTKPVTPVALARELGRWRPGSRCTGECDVSADGSIGGVCLQTGGK